MREMRSGFSPGVGFADVKFSETRAGSTSPNEERIRILPHRINTSETGAYARRRGASSTGVFIGRSTIGLLFRMARFTTVWPGRTSCANRRKQNTRNTTPVTITKLNKYNTMGLTRSNWIRPPINLS